MSAFEGSAARSFDQHSVSPAADEQWLPARHAGSPAIALPRKLHASVVESLYPELPVHPADQVLRTVSRASGYVAFAAAVAAIGWLVL